MIGLMLLGFAAGGMIGASNGGGWVGFVNGSVAGTVVGGVVGFGWAVAGSAVRMYVR